MKNIKLILPVILVSLITFSTHVWGEEYHYKSGNPVVKQTAAGCAPAANFKWLEINNVRTRINTGGDMWWDFSDAQYEIPKGSKKMSMFSAALWIGGLDANGQLKLAALRYRQVGNDYWPGPLTMDGTASITSDQCAKWDKIHAITRAEVDNFLAYKQDPGAFPGYKTPASILDYPAENNGTGQSKYLAPFYDVNGDGFYRPDQDGDYPYYDLSNELCGTRLPTREDIEYPNEFSSNLVDQVLKGDATLWWIFNDKGNIHSESKGEPIGLEIRAQAFGFSTNDEINNMTFYSYEIINRSTYRLTQTYFSQWVDTDLGFARDDYVGCDVMRGLGYCYNGPPKDGNGQIFAYGDKPPAVGVDFFQGPYIDPDKKGKINGDNPSLKGDPTFHLKGSPDQIFTGGAQLVLWDGDTLEKIVGSDTVFKIVNSAAINGVNFGDSIEDNERFGMRRFVYHNNGGANYMSDPSVASEYYNFLRGIWKDGTKMLYGGNGHISAGAFGPECDFMFPGTSDIYDWGTKGLPPNGPKNWTEVTAGNPPDDRRFMHSAGPFVLESGAVNYITVGIPWAQAQTGGPLASVALLQEVDDKCQQLFDNCFKVISGPNAPDLTIRELDQQLILYITNRKANDAGNNYQEKYTEYDPRIKGDNNGVRWDSLYHFEGYLVYQLKNASVSVADLKNQDLARLAFQCDIKNGVSQLVNFNFDANLGGAVPVQEVLGADQGIKHTVKLEKDLFSGEDLVNHKQYYYLAVAYGYNNYKDYQQNNPEALDGQKLPFLAGRKNIKVYTGIPHATIGLTSATANYGSGVIITRIAGQGNGGQFLELADESVNEILSKKMADSLNTMGGSDYPIAYNLKYKLGKGPLDVKVIDPLNVKDRNYTIKFDSMYTIRVPVGLKDTNMVTSTWNLSYTENGIDKVYTSDNSIDVLNEMLFLDLGLSVSINQTLLPGPYVVDERLTSEVGQPDKLEPVYGTILTKNGYLGGSITYSDSLKPWLKFLPDVDGLTGFDWIKAGVAGTDWSKPLPYDPEGVFENVLPLRFPDFGITGGTWTPYMFTESGKTDTIVGIAHAESQTLATSRDNNLFYDIASVDVVFTPDRTKWTRCVVIEMSPQNGSIDVEGGAKQFEIRKHRSVNQDGDTAVISSDPAKNSDLISPYGMGWFPGYAINVETGERLNIMFGEDSRLIADNGRDMLFNPTSRYIDNTGRPVVGGKHAIYIMGHVEGKKERVGNKSILPPECFDNPAYDGGANFYKQVNVPRISSFMQQVRAFQFSNCMWAAIPMANSENAWLNNEVKISLRITKPYQRYFSSPISGVQNVNNYWPAYTFETKDVATNLNDVAKATSDLDLINVVPNPYRAYDSYEVSQLDNRVKIVNLPQRCQVTIYSVNGNIIRKFNKDEAKTSIDWDLKNFAGIPIAGGVYLIHVKTDQGEKVVKWFGSLRPVDLNAF